MAAEKKQSLKYSHLRRYCCALCIICFLVTVLGSFVAGASVQAITFRSFLVVMILAYAARVIIKTWGRWEEVASSMDHRNIQKKKK